MASPEASLPNDPTPPPSTPRGRDAPPAVPSTPRRRRLPTWIIAIPLMALAATGGYLLGKPSASTTSQFGQAGAQVGQSAAGQTSSASGQAGTGQSGAAAQTRRSQSGAAQGSGASAAGGAARRGSGAVIAVSATAAKAGTLTTTRSATGTVAAAKTTTVSARSSGTVTAVGASVGQSVTAGQTVVTLSNTDLNASVASAQNALQSAQAQLSNQNATLAASRAQLQQAVKSAQLALQNAQNTYAAQQKLYAVGAVAKSALDTQEVAVQQAQSALVSAQTNVQQNVVSSSSGLRDLQLSVDKARISLQQAQEAATGAKVVAPFDGQITNVAVTGGEYLNAGTAAFSLVSAQRNLTFNVPTAQAGEMTVGRALSYVVGQQTYPVKVSSNPLSPTNGTVPITARFLSSAPALGSVGAVQYSAKVGTGVLVPTTALQVDNDKSSVYTIENSKAKVNDVNVIGQTGDTAVVSGLEDGVQVIAQPPSGLLDGARVTTSATGARAGGAAVAPGPGAGGAP